MSKLPILTAKELIKVLKRFGFKRIRQKGSHVFFAHEDGRTTIVPVHPGKDISRACWAINKRRYKNFNTRLSRTTKIVIVECWNISARSINLLPKRFFLP